MKQETTQDYSSYIKRRKIPMKGYLPIMKGMLCGGTKTMGDMRRSVLHCFCNGNIERIWACAILFALSPFLFVSCRHKELCYDHPHWTSLRVAFDFGQLSPSGMRVHFYPINGEEAYTFDFPYGQSGTISLPAGTYRAVCFNNNTEYIDYTGERNAESLQATTEKAKAPDGTDAYTTPDWLIGSSLDDVNVIRDAGKEQVVIFTPVPKVCRYSFEVHGIKNTRYISDMRATLSGMAGELLMYADRFPSGADHQILTAAIVKDETCQGGFYTFGHATEAETRNIFTLYIRNKKNKVQVFTADVTDQVRSFLVTGHLADVHIVLQADLVIDNDVPGGSGTDAGFDVDVDNWEDIQMDIIL